MNDILEDIITWFYDECDTSELESLDAVYDTYLKVVEKIRDENVLIECENLSYDDFSDPTDCTEINDEYRLFIEIPVLNENYVILFSYLKISGVYGVDLEYVEGSGSKLEDYFSDDES